MDLAESTVHSFIVKLWLEDKRGKGKRMISHGYITHVPTGARRYLKSLNDVTDFIREHVDDQDLRVDFKARARNWLRIILKSTNEG